MPGVVAISYYHFGYPKTNVHSSRRSVSPKALRSCQRQPPCRSSSFHSESSPHGPDLSFAPDRMHVAMVASLHPQGTPDLSAAGYSLVEHSDTSTRSRKDSENSPIVAAHHLSIGFDEALQGDSFSPPRSYEEPYSDAYPPSSRKMSYASDVAVPLGLATRATYPALLPRHEPCFEPALRRGWKQQTSADHLEGERVLEW